MSNRETIMQILDAARWAPSGDNTQPWRFEIIDDAHVVVHGSDTRSHCVYDLDGHPSQIALGALLETFSIAASQARLAVAITRRGGLPDTTPTFDLHFTPVPGMTGDPLAAFITSRSVQRRPMSMRALTANEKSALEAAVGVQYRVLWLEGAGNRFRAARLMYRNAKLRLTLPEAYQTHAAVIQWHARFSDDRVPDQALGVDPITTRLMQWIMGSWGRVKFFNRYLGGTLAPRIQMDFVPGMACAAHFVLLADKPPVTIDDYVAGGRATQRFWLAAAALGLQLQPELTPLIFSRYAREQTVFSADTHLNPQGSVVLRQLEDVIGADASLHSVFMGRVGAGPNARARSLRRPTAQLITGSKPR
jgi:nitroreductase